MGKVIAKQIRGMNWYAKVSLVLICTVLLSVFMYEGWYQPHSTRAAIGTTTGWTSLGSTYHTNTKTPSANIAVAGTASTGRVLVVGVTYVSQSAGTATCAMTYGGTALTQAAGDAAATSSLTHTWLFYLPENNALMDGTTKALATTITTSTTALMTDAYYMVLNGVDQQTPLGSSARPTANRTAISGSSVAFTAGSGLLVNANEQAVIIYDVVRSGSTSSQTLSAFGSAWAGSANQSSTTTNANHSYANIRNTIPATNQVEDLCGATAGSGSDVTSMTAASFRAGPSVTSASPSSAAPGTANLDVIITGSNFVSGTNATFGSGITVNSTTFNSTTQLTANITVGGAAAPGFRSITVTAANGSSTTANAFSVVSANAPTISTVTPSALGQGATSVPVAIVGANFDATSTVTDGTGLTIVTAYVDPTHLTATVTVSGNATLGARDLTVTNSSDGSSSTKSGALTINARPTVTAAAPVGGGQGTATNVTITGTGFVSGAVASFSGTGITVNSTSFVSATSLTANITIDAAATLGGRTITVVNPDFGINTSASNLFTVFNPALAPTVTSISPAVIGQGATSKLYTITGTNFVTGATVAISGSNVTPGTVTVVDANTITVLLTASTSASTGARNVTVTLPDTQAVTSTGALTVNSRPGAPTAITPSLGSTGQTINVTVTGASGLVNGAALSFSGTGITVNSTTWVSASSLTANITIASNAASGARDVIVTNPDFGTRTATGLFTVTPVGVSSASPGIGAGGTGNVTITGQGFTAAATVAIGGGVTVNSVTFVNANTLTANVTVASAATPGAYDVTVTVGANSGTGAGLFTITAPPSITSITPPSLSQGTTNTDIIINGTNFFNGSTVQFSGAGVTINSATYVSATQLTANVNVAQNAALTSRTVTITNPDGGKTVGGSLLIAPPAGTAAGAMTFTRITASSITVQVAYSNDGNNNNSCTIQWGDVAGVYSNSAVATKANGIFTATINGLPQGSDGAGKLYFFQAAFNDPDGVSGTNPVVGVQPTKGSSLMHDSMNTGSDKWPQGWGIPGSKYGAFTCSTCHSKGTTNGKLVANTISNSYENWSSTGSSNPLSVLYNNSATDLGSDSAHASSTKVCEVCHSRTDHHRYNNVGTNHQGTTDCTVCHTHDEAFIPSCRGCHSTPQGPNGYRRQIVGSGGDFYANMSTHGKFTAVSSRTCAVCHEGSSHMSFNDGVSVALKHADSGATFLYDGTSATAPNTKTVCLSCHDADGAKILGTNAMTPFSGSEDYRNPANINQYWPASGGAHSTNMQCLNCHGNSKGVDGSTTNPKYNAHASGNKHVLQDKAYDVVNPNNYCFNCHKGASTDPNKSFKNISGQMGLAYKHTTAKCFDCHGDENNSLDSLHSLRSGSQTAGSGVMANNISNATGSSMTWSATSWGGATASASLASNNATAEYQVCFKCHATTGTGTTPAAPYNVGTGSTALSNLALEFNPNNASGHPIVTGLNNYVNSASPKALTAAKLKAPWNVNLGTQVMTCSDCHATDSAASKGPHGSSVKWMLAGVNKAWPYTTAAGNGGSSGTLRSIGNYNTGDGTKDGLFCLNCHTITGSNNFHTVAANFPDQHNSTSGAAQCANCHIRVPHGGKIARLLQTTNAPGRYRANGSSTTPIYTGWGHTGVPIKGAAYSGNFACTSHHSTTGGEAW